MRPRYDVNVRKISHQKRSERIDRAITPNRFSRNRVVGDSKCPTWGTEITNSKKIVAYIHSGKHSLHHTYNSNLQHTKLTNAATIRRQAATKFHTKKGSARNDRASEKSCCNDEKQPRSARGGWRERTQGRWSIGKRHFLKGCLQAHTLEARCARKKDTYISAINIITRLSLMETRNGALLSPPAFACSTLTTYLTSKIDTEVRFLQL